MSGRSSVQDVVRVIVTRNPFIYRGLRMKVVNYSALARYIQEEVEHAFGDEVDPNTIVTAITRLNQILMPEEPRSILGGSRLNLVTGISVVRIIVPPIKQPALINHLVELGIFDSYSMMLRQGSAGVRLITNSPDADRLNLGELGYEVNVEGGFAEVLIMLSPKFDTEGGLTLVIDALAQSGVHAVDASFYGSEIGVVVREEDASRAFDVLRALSR